MEEEDMIVALQVTSPYDRWPCGLCPPFLSALANRLPYSNVRPAIDGLSRTCPSIVSLSQAQFRSCLSSQAYFTRRREDLEDLLVDPAYFQAIFHSLQKVRSLYQAQAELGLANESIASMLSPVRDHWIYAQRILCRE